MKKIIFVIFICFLVFAGCINNNKNYPNNCKDITTFSDTILINGEEVFLIVHISKFDYDEAALSEIIISKDIAIDLKKIQFKSAQHCYETSVFTEMNPITGQAFKTDDVPPWTLSEITQAIIQFSIDTTTYNLIDFEVNK